MKQKVAVVLIVLTILAIVVLVVLHFSSKEEAVKSVPQIKPQIEPEVKEIKKSEPPSPVAIKNPKEDYDKYLALGKKSLLQRDYDDAEKAFLSAKEIDDTAEVEGSLIEVSKDKMKNGAYLLGEAERLKKENKWDEAIATYESAKKFNPQDIKKIEAQIDELKQLKKEAIEAFENKYKQAQKQIEDGEYINAMATIMLAKKYFPSKKEVEDLVGRLKQKALLDDMVKIPASLTIVGSKSEGQRKVEIKTFYIDKTEVTNEQYYLFVLNTGYAWPQFWQGDKIPPGKEKYPVSGVSWADAVAFAKWSGKRLPTEDEWEKAARYIDGRTYPWGEEFSESIEVARCNSLEYNKTDLMPVGYFQKGASPYGVFDMAGNVREWTSTTVTITDENDAKEYKVLKGGSFMTPKSSVATYNRLIENPKSKFYDTGFRCAKD